MQELHCGSEPLPTSLRSATLPKGEGKDASNNNLSFRLPAKIIVGKPEHLCYNTPEVNFMDEHTESSLPEEEGYTPRPAWQVWAARVGVVVMILFVIWQILQIAGGGR